MNLSNSIFLGIVQGLTEFLPVSSSGHLVIAQHLIRGFKQPGVLFDVTLHAGTLLSVLYYFRKKILKLDFYYIKLLIIGTIPAIVFGFLFKDFFESLFTNIKLVGFALLITGLMNYFTDKFKSNKDARINYKRSLAIGLFQSFAIIPGISRSGSTIFSGKKQGLSGKKAAEFSFLLSVPAVLGANFLEMISYHKEINSSLFVYTAGFASAFVSGIIAIKLVFRFLKEKKFKLFSYYTFIVGVVVLLLT